MSNFSFSHSVFFSFGELSTIFTKLRIVVCKLFQFGEEPEICCLIQMMEFVFDKVGKLLGKCLAQGNSQNLEDPARTQDPWIMSQTPYHWAMQDPQLTL